VSTRVVRHPDAAGFLRAAGDWLLQREAEHNLVLGVAQRLRSGVHDFAPPVYLGTVEHGGAVAGCAFRTPPHKLGLTRMPLAAVPLLAADVAGLYAELPAVMGPEPETAAFAREWVGLRGGTAEEGMRQRIYEIEVVRAAGRDPPGSLQMAWLGDVPLVASWVEAFTREATPVGGTAEQVALERVTGQTVALWVDEEPRSMAVCAARTPGGARIGYVYTPPQWRGRGYASACVAELSRRILQDGARACFLHTDLGNEITNRIYTRIGYHAVCDVIDYNFAG
jgi:uncharacterized protein